MSALGCLLETSHSNTAGEASLKENEEDLGKINQDYLSKYDQFDLIIVGAGPAGLMASLCFKTFKFNVLHLDSRPQPTLCGRADGIQPRTLEVLRNIGHFKKTRLEPMSDRDEPEWIKKNNDPKSYPLNHIGLVTHLLSQGVKVYDAAFWDPTESQLLSRTSRAKTCPDFIDIRDRFTLLLHQGLIEKEFIREISHRALSSSLGVPQIIRPAKFILSRIFESSSELPITSSTFANQHHGTQDYPVVSQIRCFSSKDEQEKEEESPHNDFWIKSKYLIGCDGARSDVRKSLNNQIRLNGWGSNVYWGVMDCWVESDFPDLKLKCLIHSKHDGSIMILPREDNLIRIYVQLKEVVEPDSILKTRRDEASLMFCQEQAKKIFKPFKLEFLQVDWFSIYQIAQRLANKYTVQDRIILGGDAVHTHSPKAGQGMNISMMDMYSLAWKINLIEKGIGKRKEIMETYEVERRGVAAELLALDSQYSALFSGVSSPASSLSSSSPRPSSLASSTSSAGSLATTLSSPNLETRSEHQADLKIIGDVDAYRFIDAFKRNAYFASGCGAIYHANIFNALPESSLFKNRAYTTIRSSLIPGQRLLPGLLTRFIDGNPVEIEQEIIMDGSFRLYVFVGKSSPEQIYSRIAHLDEENDRNKKCFLKRFKPTDQRGCSIFDDFNPINWNNFFSLSLISSRNRADWEIEELPELFSKKFPSRVYLDDRINQICDLERLDSRSFQLSNSINLHAKYGIDEDENEGGGIIVVRPDGYVGLIVNLNQDGWDTIEDYFDGFLINRDYESN